MNLGRRCMKSKPRLPKIMKNTASMPTKRSAGSFDLTPLVRFEVSEFGVAVGCLVGAAVGTGDGLAAGVAVGRAVGVTAGIVVGAGVMATMAFGEGVAGLGVAKGAVAPRIVEP